MAWLEHSARKKRRAVEVVELWGDRLREHLINKRGYTPSEDGVIKLI